jgi:uroporphyrinogen-III synthase
MTLREAGFPFRNVLFLAGRDRKTMIEATLSQLGVLVEVAVVYAAQARPGLPRSAAEALSAGDLDAVLHFSRRSASILLDLAALAGLSENLHRLHHVCLSLDVAAALSAVPTVPVIAARPESSALFEALESL